VFLKVVPIPGCRL